MTEAMTAPESLEPEVVVTEADRRAAFDALYCTTCARVEQWIATGEGPAPGLSGAHHVAHAIARARTMGAFEERVRCVRRTLVSDVLVSNVADVPLATVFDWLNTLDGRAPTDDDIRRLVLAGWARGGE